MDPDKMILGLESDWAILLALFFMTAVQIIKIIMDGSKFKRDKEDRTSAMRTNIKIEAYLKIISAKYTEEVTERQLPVVIHEFLNNYKSSLIVKAAAIITRNDIVNREREVRAKLSQFVRNSNHTLIVNFGLFKYKDNALSQFVKPEWSIELTEGVLDIVINVSTKDRLEAYRQLGSYIDQKFDHYCTGMLSKVYEL